MRFLITILVNAVSIYMASALLSGVKLRSFLTGVWVGALLALVNATIVPVLQFLLFPLALLTFGIAYFLVNVAMIMLIDKLVSGFKIKDFWWACLFSLVISIINTILLWIF